MTSSEAGLSGAGARAGPPGAEPHGRASTMAEAGPAGARATMGGAAAAEAASTEDTEAAEAGDRGEAAEVSDREAPSQGECNDYTVGGVASVDPLQLCLQQQQGILVRK